ncbi:MAG: DNA recombination protein RmuC [Candidatus Zhuqueibacterota bacterium]
MESNPNWFIVFAAFGAGIFIGLAIAALFKIFQSKSGKELANELFRESEQLRQANLNAILENIKMSFGHLSLDALSKSTEEFLKLAKARLDVEREASVREMDKKKSLIDVQLQRMTTELDNVSNLMKALERDRAQKYGELTHQLKAAGDQTSELIKLTSTLKDALANTKARGQWGERMAEDVLRLAGFIENVNYFKQKSLDSNQSRPDFTFLLPRDLKLNMDVKFPLNNYLRYLESGSEIEKAKYKSDFLRDVKARIREVTTREYINPEFNTVDYVLLFIPNEHIYTFIHEHDNTLLDEAIRNRVVFSSPITLYAILAVIRQAVDNFALERTSNEILSLFGAFKKQWIEFMSKLEQLGKRINDAQKEYESLSTTRKRQLEKPLNQIDALRSQRGLPIAIIPESESGEK